MPARTVICPPERRFPTDFPQHGSRHRGRPSPAPRSTIWVLFTT